MKLRLLSQWIRKRLIASRCRRKIGVRCKYKIRPDGLLAPEGESATYSARQDLSYFTSWQRSAVVLPLACLRSGAEVHSAEGHNRRSPHSSSLARVETEKLCSAGTAYRSPVCSSWLSMANPGSTVRIADHPIHPMCSSRSGLQDLSPPSLPTSRATEPAWGPVTRWNFGSGVARLYLRIRRRRSGSSTCSVMSRFAI